MLELKELRLDHAKFLLENIRDKTLLAGKGCNINPHELTIEDEKKWILEQIKINSEKEPSSIKYIIALNEVPIGLIGTISNDFVNLNCEVYYWISKNYRGNGYASYALKLFIKKIEGFNFKRIEARVLKQNISSQKVLERCGFRCEGEKVKSTRFNDNFYNDLIYGLIIS